MEKQVYDEKNGLWYELHGDYYLPCLTVSPEERRSIGVWGQRHLRYLRQHRKELYTQLQITGKLNGYLADLNEQAEDMFFELVKQMAAREGVTEELKAQDQMLWVQHMNNIRNRAIKARIVCGAVHENGMGLAYTVKFFQPLRKPFPTNGLFRVAVCGRNIL